MPEPRLAKHRGDILRDYLRQDFAYNDSLAFAFSVFCGKACPKDKLEHLPDILRFNLSFGIDTNVRLGGMEECRQRMCATLRVRRAKLCTGLTEVCVMLFDKQR